MSVLLQIKQMKQIKKKFHIKVDDYGSFPSLED